MITIKTTHFQRLPVAAPIIKILDNFADLRTALAQSSTPLYESAALEVFYSLAWFEVLHLHGLTPVGQPLAKCKLILAIGSNRHHAVCLPLISTRTLSSLSNFYSCLYDCLKWSMPGTANAVALPTQHDCDAICQSIVEHAPNCPLITLSPLDAESPFYSHMQTALARAGYWADNFFCFGNWYLQVAQRSFAQYYTSLPSPLRHSIERGQRRLQRQGAWRVEIHQSDAPALGLAIDGFVQVYAQSWKGPEPHPHFIPELIRLTAREGWLRLGILSVGNQPVAAQLWLVKSAKASIYKLAYVTGFERLSVGSVLSQAMMKHVIDVDKVQEVDYLTGDDAYKRDWMSHRRERRGLVAFQPKTAGGLWRAFKHFGSKKIKNIFLRVHATSP